MFSLFYLSKSPRGSGICYFFLAGDALGESFVIWNRESWESTKECQRRGVFQGEFE